MSAKRDPKPIPKPETPSVTKSSVNFGFTVADFAGKIEKDLAKNLERDRQKEQLRLERRKLMITLLAQIKDELKRATSINLGERYSFSLVIRERDGWPLLRMELNDAAASQGTVLCYEVSAHDRKETGTILFGELSQKPDRVELANEDSVESINAKLRKSLRSYFDEARGYLTDQQREAEDEVYRSNPTHVIELNEIDVALVAENLFMDDRPTSPENRVDIDETPAPPIEGFEPK